MKTKLTLRLDESAIGAAKEYAREKGTSVSQLVEQFFEQLASSSEGQDDLTPHVRALLGRIEGADVDEETYRDHLADKYL